MALKTIRVQIKGWQQGLTEAIQAMKDIEAGKPVKKRAGEYFQDLEAVRSVLTTNRLALLKLIRQLKPASIAALARLVKRDFKAVYGDVEILKTLGLVKTPRSRKGKSSALRSDTTEIVFRIAV